MVIKSALAFSFCFSFTELQLETVSKAFHITAKYWRRQGIEVLLLNFALKFIKCTSVGLSTSALLLPI